LVSDALANSILEVFCAEQGIQPRDLGVGRFHSQTSSRGTTPVNGVCIFDNSNVSLRLTERLAANFPAVVTAALNVEIARGNAPLVDALERLLARLGEASPAAPSPEPTGSAGPDPAGTPEHWLRIIAPNSKAMLTTPSGMQEVSVLGHF
jgi:hypothetical protein